ncbi:hypothetical protein F0562_028097 [Nyssa sinensis]|uniref:C2 domain-containing protein n=1 Tax=Nyssa sinensis TaxID=561372 RepID=A0A5J5B9B4_9ASTE|nr:hypothetical protein F0562_028097 [Nyssa sinensis]
MGCRGKLLECRKFQITLISAKGLENIRTRFKMEVYARVSIGDLKKTEKRTPADKHGETNPAWSHMVSYTIADAALRYHSLMLVIKLYCKRKLCDRYIGEVHTSIKELCDQASLDGGSTEVETPPTWKRALQYGVSIFLGVAFFCFTGVYCSTEVSCCTNPNIIYGDADADADKS